MKFRRCTIDHCEIKEIMNIGHFEKLAELRDDNSTLEVELPNMYLICHVDSPTSTRVSQCSKHHPQIIMHMKSKSMGA